MTARPDREAEPLSRTPDTQGAGTDFEALHKAEKGRPHSPPEDGRAGGASQGGRASPGNFSGQPAAGINVQSGRESGTENERTAPGMSTDKKQDDTR